jgi:hypothetical protein
MFDLRRLFGGKAAKKPGPAPALEPILTPRSASASPARVERIELEQSRTFSYGLAGPTHHEAALRHFYGRGELDATIQQDKLNPVDPNAIKVTVEGRLIGYFHAEDCEGFNNWIRWRGYDGRAFKVPAIVEAAGLLKGKLRILLIPPRVVGDLDRSTKKAVDVILRQTGPACVKHMHREPREAGDGTLARLVETDLIEHHPCAVCGAGGYAATDRTWMAKFGQGAAFVREHPSQQAVSGWVED